jgi:hypothetical protein
MSNLEEFKKIFDSRHDFNDSDLEILFERYPTVEFKNIPTAWIISVDEFLCKTKYHNPIISISQEFGQIIIQYNKNPEHQEFIDKYQAYAVVLERKIYEADKDLYQQYGIKIGEFD